MSAASIDFLGFCWSEPEKCRYGFEQPWIDGENLVATDGRILIVAEPNAYGGDLNTGNHPPRWREVLSGLNGAKPWRKLPRWEPCQECGDDGFIFHDKCPECGCPDAKAKCRACATVKIGRVEIARAYAKKISDLPDCRWAPCDDGSVFLKFNGGYGRLMGLGHETP